MLQFGGIVPYAKEIEKSAPFGIVSGLGCEFPAFVLRGMMRVRNIMENRENELLKRITIDPNMCHGKPVIRGMRYPVVNILELMSSGMTHAEILADYEDLEEADLQACLLFAAKMMEVKSVSRLVA